MNPADLPNKTLFNPSEVAQILGVSRKTVYNWISMGQLEAKTVGSRLIRITRESLMACIVPLDEE